MSEIIFSDAVKLRTYQNAGLQCQCVAGCPEHPKGRCMVFIWHYHEAHYYPIDPDGSDDIHNCQMLCLRCHRNAEARSTAPKADA
jgi:hypothetical protein